MSTKKSTKVIQVKEGVHWGWWVFWLIMFWPALLVVWLVHANKEPTEYLEITETITDEHGNEMSSTKVEKKQ